MYPADLRPASKDPGCGSATAFPGRRSVRRRAAERQCDAQHGDGHELLAVLRAMHEGHARGTGNLHLWHTKVTKNKAPVKKDVDEETANRCVERDLYIMNRPQNQGQGHCDGHHYKRSCAVPEINCTLFDHSSVGCIDPEKLLREKQRDHHADDGHSMIATVFFTLL